MGVSFYMIDISILMPVYNAEKYLNKTIDSIKNQSFSNWELIIVDDGSIDNSKEICTKYISRKFRCISYQKCSS